LAGWSFIVVLVASDIGTISLLYGPKSGVFSSNMYVDYVNSNFNQACVLGLVLVTACILLVILGQRVARRFGVKFVG
jgi:ABC-type Fe3+ transport system permease subunit